MMNDDMKEAVDSVEESDADPTIFVAATGVKLKLRRVPQMVVADAAKHLRAPKVPRTFDTDKQREIENPLDPDYVAAVTQYQMDMGMLAVNVYLVLGTTVLSAPRDMAPLESDTWCEEIATVFPEVDIPIGGPRRRLAWLKYYALSDEDHSQIIQRLVRLSGGTMEADVATAQATFRNNALGDTARRIPVTDEVGRGDSVDANTRNGARVGSEGSGSIHALPVAPMDTSGER